MYSEHHLTPAQARRVAMNEILLGRTPAHRDLLALGYDAYVGDSVKDVVKKIRDLAAKAGKLDRYNADRSLRHYILYGALHRHAHNLDVYRWIYNRGGIPDSHPLAKFLSPTLRCTDEEPVNV